MKNLSEKEINEAVATGVAVGAVTGTAASMFLFGVSLIFLTLQQSFGVAIVAWPVCSFITFIHCGKRILKTKARRVNREEGTVRD